MFRWLKTPEGVVIDCGYEERLMAIKGTGVRLWYTHNSLEIPVQNDTPESCPQFTTAYITQALW